MFGAIGRGGLIYYTFNRRNEQESLDLGNYIRSIHLICCVPCRCHTCANGLSLLASVESQLCQALGTECDKHCYAIDTTSSVRP